MANRKKFNLPECHTGRRYYLINHMVNNNPSENTTTSPNTSIAKWSKTAIFTFLSTKFSSLELLSSKSRIRQTPEF